MDQITLKRKMQSERLSVLDGTLEDRVYAAIRAVQICIPATTRSDRTCIANVADWLLRKCKSETFPPEEVLPRVIDFALEASTPEARNPAAVFMSILKKEFNYPN